MSKDTLNDLSKQYSWQVLATADLLFKLLEDDHFSAAKALCPSVRENLEKFKQALVQEALTTQAEAQ